jgi:NAD(P)H dehydrogenase (quinone)
MRVLTVYAHPNPESFCHAILGEFTRGLEEAGHTSEVVDLYAIHFDPVFRTNDFASYVHESMPLSLLKKMNLRQRVLEGAGGPVQRFVAGLWLRNKDPKDIARFIHSHRPRDVTEQWDKVKNAQGLCFISAVFWLHFPAILKGWFERVFAYGDAYALTMQGWQGHAKGRVPLLKHEKALVISTTLFSKADYKAKWELPMRRIIDEWGLRYPGIKHVEHVYFYGVPMSTAATRRRYLEQAHQLGREFSAS